MRNISSFKDNAFKMLKLLLPACFLLSGCLPVLAQQVNCTFKEPVLTINFGSGRVPDLNTEDPSDYARVTRYCPTDGHYAYTSYTSDCFRGDWHTLTEDHTAGDADGNMMIVNAAPYGGAFLRTPILGLKGGTIYEFSVWMMNICRPTDKCPFPLLPQISIVFQTPDGKVVTQLGVGELPRTLEPSWGRYQVLFTTPPSTVPLTLTMIDSAPGGCGNDFALDDISFRECIKIPPPPPVVRTTVKTPVTKKKPEAAKPAPKKETPVIVAKKEPPPPKPLPKKDSAVVVKVMQKPAPKKEVTPPPALPKKDPVAEKPAPKKQPVLVKATPEKKPALPEKKDPPVAEVGKAAPSVVKDSVQVIKRVPFSMPAPPPLVRSRSNPLVRQIEIPAGEFTLNLYDNGEIDGDTITIYHNNELLVSHARLSQKPITLNITIDADHPHHEFIMVAENLGSIPPNTSLMVITTATQRFEVFISSTEQKNAKVVIDLKE